MVTTKDQGQQMVALPGLRVVGAGFPRTGTLSTKAAMEILLGGPCYHMTEVLKALLPHLKAWNNLYDLIEAGQLPPCKVPADMGKVLSPFKATMDAPAMLFYKELWEAAPGCKVLLTIRDNPDCWYDSMVKTIYQMYLIWTSMPSWVLYCLPGMNLLSSGHAQFWGDKGPFKSRFHDREFIKQVYEDHIKAVKATIPPEHLLIFNVKEGWEPLCKFLGLPVPDQPFPYVNESRDFAENHIKPARRFKAVVVALPWVTCAVLVGAVAYWWATATPATSAA